MSVLQTVEVDSIKEGRIHSLLIIYKVFFILY